MIEFIRHEFLNDEYVKEIVYLQFDKKYRVAYARKTGKNGNLFWSCPSISFMRDGQRVYASGFILDSKFLEEEVKNLLESRSWEKDIVKLNILPNQEKYPDERDAVPF